MKLGTTLISSLSVCIMLVFIWCHWLKVYLTYNIGNTTIRHLLIFEHLYEISDIWSLDIGFLTSIETRHMFFLFFFMYMPFLFLHSTLPGGKQVHATCKIVFLQQILLRQPNFIEVTRLSQGWCKFCHPQFLFIVPHLKQDVCCLTRRCFISVCLAQPIIDCWHWHV